MTSLEPTEPIAADLHAGPAGRSRRGAWRAAAAASAAAAVVAGGITIAVVRSRDHESPPPRLLLAPRSEAARDSLAMPLRPTQYRLDGTLPDLGARAAVYRLAEPRLDDARVSGLARALGLTGRVEPVAGALQVTDGTATLTVQTNGAATLLYAHDSSGGSIGGSPGSTGTGTAGATTGGAPVPAPSPPADAPIVSPATDTPPTATTVPPEPAPDAAEAQRVATELLDRMGVLGDHTGWQVSVSDGESSGVAVACAVGVVCPPPPPATVTTRLVTYARIVDGVAVRPADWSVMVAAHDRIDSVSGTLGTIERVGNYALTPVHDAFDALASGRAVLPGPQPLQEHASGAAVPPVRAVPVPAPEPTISTQPFVVSVTGARLGYAEWLAAGDAQSYIVPTYRFSTRDESGTTGEVEVLALTADSFTQSTTSSPRAPDSSPLTSNPGQPTPVTGPDTAVTSPAPPAPPASDTTPVSALSG